MFKFLIILLLGSTFIFGCSEDSQDGILSSEAPLINSSVPNEEEVNANSAGSGNEEQFPNVLYIGPNETVTFNNPVNVKIIDYKLARYVSPNGSVHTIASIGDLQVIGFTTDPNGFIIYETPEGMITILED